MASMRLQRALARAGVASRRHAEELIRAGRVQVNGSAAAIGQSVDPTADTITLDGHSVQVPADAVWLLMNKPPGVLTASVDNRGRRTVFDLLPERIPGLTYVGRLDYLTGGLLLLTNDGPAIHALTHPSRGIEREYSVTVTGDAAAALPRLQAGIMLEDGPVHPRNSSATRLGPNSWELRVTIAEGRKREIRRLCKALHLRVDSLTRVRFGPIVLGELPPGESRPLTRSEQAALDAAIDGG